jgi:putative acetyltransferase
MIRTIQQNDNKDLAFIIRESLKAYGLNIPGTVYTDPTTDDLFSLFKREGAVYFVAMENDVVLGGCGIFPTEGLPDKCAELVKLYLREEARGKGLGYRLMETALNWAADYGYKEIYLETFQELSFAMKLYFKFGFKELEAPLGNSGHHACQIWMLKSLDEGNR